MELSEKKVNFKKAQIIYKNESNTFHRKGLEIITLHLNKFFGKLH